MTEDNAADQSDLVMLTAEIVSAQVAGNKIATSEIAPLIQAVHAALAGLGRAAPVAPETPKRPIGVRASIKDNGLVSMIDGKLYQSLKRHVTRHGYTPESYRQAFDLPRDYPMVSKAYSDKRRDLARSFGLGRKPKEVAEQAVRTIKGGLKGALASAKTHLGGEADHGTGRSRKGGKTG